MTLDNFGTWTEVFADEYFAQVSFLCWRGQSLKPRRRVVSSHFDHHWSQNKSHRMSKEYLETKFHHVSSLCSFFSTICPPFLTICFSPCLFNVSPFWSILHQFLTIFPRISPFLIIFPWFFLGFCFGFIPLFQHFSHVERMLRFCHWAWESRRWRRFPAEPRSGLQLFFFYQWRSLIGEIWGNHL